MDRAQRAAAIDGGSAVGNDIDRQQECPANFDVIKRCARGVEGDPGDAGVIVHHPGEGGLVSA